MNKKSKIYIAGHNGMVGSAILRHLIADGYHNIITCPSKELDLRNQIQVLNYFEKEKPEFVFLAAAKVGGILANNKFKGEFLFDNLMIQNNVIHSAYLFGVKKLMFLGSSCIYPKMAPQPLKEEYLLTGPLEPTNDAYAIAKIAGIKLCDSYRDQFDCNFISVMPTNLYGPNDNYDLNNSHVLPALLRKFHEATLDNSTEVVVWGSGVPKREFLHSDDMADACIYLMKVYDEEGIINIGTGSDLSIEELALMIKNIVGFKGNIIYDRTKPDGTPRKLLDVSKLAKLGWKAKISLKAGIEKVYSDMLKKL